MNCIAPATTRLLRKVDKLFVEGLKQKMREDPTAPGQNNEKKMELYYYYY